MRPSIHSAVKASGWIAVTIALFWGTVVDPGPWTRWLLAPVAWVVDAPHLALIPALFFTATAVWWRRSGLGHPRYRSVTWRLAACALLWVGYAVYEFAMWRWARTVKAPIRIDLLLIAPVLYAMTGNGLFALWAGVRFAWAGSDN